MEDIYGISQNPVTKNYILILNTKNYCKKCSEKFTNMETRLCEPCQFSGNEKINDFIKEPSSNKILKWIPHNQFNNIEEIGKGGFATIYSATWENKTVALKCLHG